LEVFFLSSRSAYFDHVKLALMMLVVIGHFISPLKNSDAAVTLWKWIFTFHMPLFIFINGYFSSVKKSPTEKCIRFFLLYLAMQTLSTNCMLIFRFDDLSFGLLTPRFGLWYLLGLIVWSLALPLTKKVPAGILLPSAVMFSLIAGYYEQIGETLALSRILFFFPFFLLGFYAKQLNREQVAAFFRHPLWKIGAVAVLCGLAVWLYRYGDKLPLGLFLAKTAYSPKLLALPGPAFLYRLGYYMAACLAGGAFLLLVPHKAGPFSVLGQCTLAVYLGHLLILDVFKDHIPLLAQHIALPGIILLAVVLTLILCHPVFMKPLDRLMRMPVLPAPAFPFLPHAPLVKRLRHWRHWRQWRRRMLRVR
jgi:fucose 4-O-acetylase-like acetyltransferase